MKQLVLIRHGKARAARGGEPDFDRPLTAAGRDALTGQGGLPRSLRELLGEARPDVEIWTSPALRARQTADEARRALKALDGRSTGPLEHICLWEQDEQAFIAELAATDAGCVIAVGHEPFTGRMLETLSGTRECFSPGAAALVEFIGAVGSGDGELIAFVPGPEVA